MSFNIANLIYSGAVSYTHLDVYKRQVELSRPIVFGEDRLRERGSLPDTFFVLLRVFCMANDNSRKFKQNHIIFCIQPWIVEYSRPIVFGEDQLRERGSLPATFYVLTRVFFLWRTITAVNWKRISHMFFSTRTWMFLAFLSHFQ